jgi:hypothetical protein
MVTEYGTTMLDLFWQKQLNDIYDIFAAGSPPLVLQLLALNTAFMLIRGYCNLTERRFQTRQSSVNLIQVLLLSANIATVVRSDPAFAVALF